MLVDQPVEQPLKGSPTRTTDDVPDEEQAKEAMNKAIQKLPIKARVITREETI